MFVRLARPIPFDAIDDQSVNLVALLTPAAAGNEHLAALAAISRRMSDPKVVQHYRAAPSAAQLFAELAGARSGQAA